MIKESVEFYTESSYISMFVLCENNYLSNIKSVLILKHKCFIHVHTISRKKARHSRHLLALAPLRIFVPHFFTIEDVSVLEKLNHKTKTK